MNHLAPSTFTTARKRRKMLVADLLCGAGGSSTGAQRALTELGLEMDLVAVNHWPVAIATHEKNHPSARHYVQDIATVRPHLLVPEGYLDLLMASPTCTHHSVARGGKPTSDQQRSDPWHIITWLTELRVKRIIIENVWEFIGWGPVDQRTGKPVKSRKGEYFNAWIRTIEGLGFKLEWRKLNAADYGDATTRQRFILMGRSDRKRIVWPVATHARRDARSADLFESTTKPWRAAREIIDWSIKGRSIFDRPKPLAPKTLMRIHAGAVKLNWPEPFIVVLRNHMAAQGIDVPLPTIAARGNHIGVAEPVLIETAHGVDAGDRDPHARRARSAEHPLGTIHAGGGNFGLAEPMLCGNRTNNVAKSLDEPVSGITTTTGGGQFLAEPAIVNMKGRSTSSPSSEPLPTMTAHAAHLFAAEPVILSQHTSGAPRGASDPLPTITTGGAGADERQGCARPMLIEPFILSQASGGAPRAVGLPLPTIVTGGDKGSGTALIAPYYGSGSGETCSSSDEPLPTVTSKGRFGMVVPVTHTAGGNAARDAADPLPTITTAKGGEFAVVMPLTHGGGEDRAAGADVPLPTITGANRGEIAVVEPGPQYDILFRMLEPEELAAAMGFSDDDVAYEFTGTKTERVKQVGNAVSVAKMKACVRAIMADAAP